MPRHQRAYVNAPPLPMASVTPGRVHLWEMPAHWYVHGRDTTRRDTAGLVMRNAPDPERAAFRSRQQAMDAAGWLWLQSRDQWHSTNTGKNVRFRQAFWTLTVPEAMPEASARRALSSYWTWARNVSGVASYLWVAEVTKRGRVHFHYLVNDWQDVSEVNRAWYRALRREGLSDDWTDAPGNLVDVEPVRSAKKARRYVSKYFGKEFGSRADQLSTRYVWASKEINESRREFLPEIRAHVFETLAAPSKVRRRWGASEDLERKPLQLNGAEDPQRFAMLYGELQSLPGTVFGKRSEKGQGCYYELDAVTSQTAPVLWSMLNA